MEQYPIPQFIEQEAKIAFFISFRQFFYLVGAGAVCFVIYFVLPFFIFVILAPVILIATLILAFVTIDGMPIINTILNSLGFLMKGQNYTWKKKESPYPFKTIKRSPIKKISDEPVLRTQRSRLKKIHTDVELRTK